MTLFVENHSLYDEEPDRGKKQILYTNSDEIFSRKIKLRRKTVIK